MPLLGTIIKTAIELKSKLPSEKRQVNPLVAQRKTLKKLLRKAQLTSFGEKYGFSEMLKTKDPIEKFQKRIPHYYYKTMYRDWWFRNLNGESYVSWPGRVKYFALSSGTSESASKHIPVTADMIKAIRKTSVRQLVSLVNFNLPKNFFNKGILMLGGSTHLQYNGTYYEGDLSGINTGRIPFWFQHHYKPGKRISKERDWQTKLDEIIKKAPEWDIGAIVGVPAWFQILLEKIIEKHQLNNIHDIWPNLEVFCHGGVAFGPYVKGFEKLLGRPIHYIETYLASEGFIAYQSRPNTSSMQMVFDNGIFYEFIPFNDENFDSEGNMRENIEALTIDKVEEGKEYALLMSTCAGAWRYLIGDTIKFTSLEKQEMIITGRTKHFLSICGEHLSVENMNRAVELYANDVGINIKEFAVAGVKHGSMFAHKWFIGTDDSTDTEIARKKIDEYLKMLNDDYRVERLEAIRDVYVEILPSSVFYDYLRKLGKEGAQNKFPRVLRNPQLTEWESFIEEYKSNLAE